MSNQDVARQEDAAPQVAAEVALHPRWDAPAHGVGFLGLGEENLQMMQDPRVQGRLGGRAGAIDGTGRAIRRRRLMAGGLVLPHRRAVNGKALLDFLVYGVPHAFYAILGAEAQGVPTAHSGPLLSGRLESAGVIVWPSAEGRIRGESLIPLYDGAAGLASRAPELYALLTLVDALRVGRARERRIATDLLEARLREAPAE